MNIFSFIRDKFIGSNSIENIVGVISIIDGIHCITRSIQELKPVNEELDIALEIAVNTWSLPEHSKKYEQLQEKLISFDNTFNLSNTDIISFTSFSMLLMEETSRKLKGKKLKIMERIESLINQIHKFFDPEIDQHECYDIAEEMYLVWQQN